MIEPSVVEKELSIEPTKILRNQQILGVYT
jgi:hypothetical protein